MQATTGLGAACAGRAGSAEDQALAVYPKEAETSERETLEGIQRGVANVKASRTESAQQVFARLRRKHGIASRVPGRAR